MVGEHIEHALAIGWRADLELHRARTRERIGFKGDTALDAETRPPLPIRSVGIACCDFHEGGERLVQPDAIPPAHGDQVTEPHVGQFVCHNVSDKLLLVLGARFGVDEEQTLAECDAAEVLHRPGREIGERDKVHLLPGVSNSVVLLKPTKAECADIKTKSGQVTFAWHVDNAERGSVNIDCLGGFEPTDNERDQVGAHHHRVGKANGSSTSIDRAFYFWSVGDCRQALGNIQRHPKYGLVLRFVPAWESTTAIGCLHLCGGDDLFVAVVIDVGAPIKTAEPVIQYTAEFDGQPGLAFSE